MFKQLNILLPIIINVKEMCVQREQLVVMSFLVGLKLEFGAIRSQIFIGMETLTLKVKLLYVA